MGGGLLDDLVRAVVARRHAGGTARRLMELKTVMTVTDSQRRGTGGGRW